MDNLSPCIIQHTHSHTKNLREFHTETVAISNACLRVTEIEFDVHWRFYDVIVFEHGMFCEESRRVAKANVLIFHHHHKQHLMCCFCYSILLKVLKQFFFLFLPKYRRQKRISLIDHHHQFLSSTPNSLCKFEAH